MRFGSTAKVLLKCKLKYYRISECMPASYQSLVQQGYSVLWKSRGVTPAGMAMKLPSLHQGPAFGVAEQRRVSWLNLLEHTVAMGCRSSTRAGLRSQSQAITGKRLGKQNLVRLIAELWHGQGGPSQGRLWAALNSKS